MKEVISIKKASCHNLKNISLDIPKKKIVVITGVSGSGKSSLAFDTIFAEGQRRYIESLSPYARQFLGEMKRPPVEEISGLSPAIAINQKALSSNPRSTVATLTEIYDYLRVLFARIGKPFCPICKREIKNLSKDEIVDIILEKKKKLKSDKIIILSPVVFGRKGEYYQLLYDYLNKGFERARIDKEFVSLHDRIELSRYKNHTIEILIDQIENLDKTRIFEGVELSLELSNGLVNILHYKNKKIIEENLLSSSRTCPFDGFSFPEIEPRLFSFNSPYGACPYCKGLGKEYFGSDEICPECKGKRLRKESLSVKILGKNIYDITTLTIKDALDFFEGLINKLSPYEEKIASNLILEILSRLEFLHKVGLDYLTLHREAGTLSGGEAQRIRLASQIGSKLSGAIYVLDEPTIGLHERDTNRLIEILKSLRDLGNTIIVVEHDETTIKNSDFLIDLGPLAGRQGGEITAYGKTSKLLTSSKKFPKSLTLKYLRGERKIEIPKRREKITEKLCLLGCNLHNLKNINVEIPLRKLVCITGVSGSGKSTLFEIISKNLPKILYRTNLPLENVSQIKGTEYLHRVVEITQSPIGRTPRSNPATYTGVFTPIRELFASLEEARERGYSMSRFSFNVKGGRCEACEGAGYKLVEMHFLPPVLVECEVCHGKRFNRETLEVKYKGKNIADVLELSVNEAYELFKDIPVISEKLKLLKEVGLGYIQLGQSATTLSGGEAQRIKLARELNKPFSYRTLYLLDEPTVGLHYEDVKMLLKVLSKLVDNGNTVLLIEHNLHVIKSCDFLIDLGPEGGDKGGRIVATGTPEEVALNKHSWTGKFLRKILFRT
ncbi:excinuclease ABC subunit UvrA [bacterium]|nr:excinuclease ABC subunit UvrA [bacterium]